MLLTSSTIMVRYAAIEQPPLPTTTTITAVVSLHVLLGGVLISLAGSAMHFVYHWTHCNAVAAIFCAVNESTWEHVKIMLFPILFWWLTIGFVENEPSALVCAAVSAYMALYVLLLGNGLSLLCGFETLWFDISLFVVSILCGQSVASWVILRGFRYSAPTPAALAVLVLALALFTYKPPPFAYLFQDHSKKNETLYGVPSRC
jgi:hypothetical protein